MVASRQSPIKRNSIHFIIAVLVVLTASLLVSFIHQIIRSSQLEAQRNELATEVAALHAETDRLQAAVEHVESDVYVEQVAREQLGYARQDDTVVFPRFVAPSPMPEHVTPPEQIAVAEPPPHSPNWKRWWQALFAY
jgi:cell division protein FtsB